MSLQALQEKQEHNKIGYNFRQIELIENSNRADFESYVNVQLKEGWKISSTNCGTINSEAYDF